MSYASFEDYTDRFLGRAIGSEADFDRFALRASVVLDRLSFGRAARYPDPEGKLRLACCALAEKLRAQEENDAAAIEEQVGDYRVKRGETDARTQAAELAALAEFYLTGTGLLYRGIPCTRRIP